MTHEDKGVRIEVGSDQIDKKYVQFSMMIKRYVHKLVMIRLTGGTYSTP